MPLLWAKFRLTVAPYLTRGQILPEPGKVVAVIDLMKTKKFGFIGSAGEGTMWARATASLKSSTNSAIRASEKARLAYGVLMAIEKGAQVLGRMS